jgi:hypothetical protein
MDGTGQLLGEFVRALRPDVEPIVVTYPPDVPLGYEQLETFVGDRLPSDRPFVLLGESFSGLLKIHRYGDLGFT